MKIDVDRRNRQVLERNDRIDFWEKEAAVALNNYAEQAAYIRDVIQQIENIRDDKIKLEKKLEQLEKKYDQLETKYDQAMRKIDRLEQENDELKQENENLRKNQVSVENLNKSTAENTELIQLEETKDGCVLTVKSKKPEPTLKPPPRRSNSRPEPSKGWHWGWKIVAVVGVVVIVCAVCWWFSGPAAAAAPVAVAM